MSKAEFLNVSQAMGTGRAVQSLVLETLDLMGAAVDVVELDVYDVLLPGDQFKRITFDPEIAQERDDCELVTYGTPFLESMVEVAKTRGRLQVRQIESRAEVPQNLEDSVANLVHFVKCKPPKVGRTWMEEGLLLLCQFVVTFQADEVVEKLMTTLIDLQSLADLTHLHAALDRHWFTVGLESNGTMTGSDQLSTETANRDRADALADRLNPRLHPISTPFRLTDGVAWAVHALEPRIEKTIAHIQSQNNTQREDELAKSRHYYEATLKKLDKQWSATTDAEKKGRLKQKIEATKLDRDHRMEDISRAYEVTAEVRLDQAILYRVPVVCVQARVQQRIQVYPYVFRYHPWASAWGPVTCPVCHEAAMYLERGTESWHCGCEQKRIGHETEMLPP